MRLKGNRPRVGARDDTYALLMVVIDRIGHVCLNQYVSHTHHTELVAFTVTGVKQ